MTDPADRINALLADHGRMNFSQDCRSSDLPARITMDDANVYIATGAGSGAVVAMPFNDAQVEGDGLSRIIKHRKDERAVEVAFADKAELDRFLRVLRVRQEGTLVQPAAQRPDPGAASPARRRQSLGAAGATIDLHRQYRIWLDWALLASTLLLIVAWVDLVAAGIATVALLIKGDGLAALVWLFVAVGGFATPFCVAALTRVVAYRFRLQDQAASS